MSLLSHRCHFYENRNQLIVVLLAFKPIQNISRYKLLSRMQYYFMSSVKLKLGYLGWGPNMNAYE